MHRIFAHAVVSMLLVSLMLSGCYYSRNLSSLATRDAATIEQARYAELRAIPVEQLSAVELAERDDLQRMQYLRDSIRVGTEKEFDRQLLIRRDSIILEQARYEVLMSTPDSELGQVEATALQHQQMQRDHTLAVVEAELQDRGLDVPATVFLVFFGVVVVVGVSFLSK